MPRKARVVLPGCPHHVVQRGHNRQVVFVKDRDYQYYLQNLAECKEQLGCRVYAYCLMTNHVHLIIDPRDDAANLAALMKRVAGRQTRLVNRLECRTGSLWDGRYKSSAIETDRYLLACCRYVELNPVRASMVSDPLAYRWSSYRAKVGFEACDWLDPDPCYLGLGQTTQARREQYTKWVLSGTPASETRLIREASQRGQLIGSGRFRDEVERSTGWRVELRGPGRPKCRTTGQEK
jgi:putative transposase